MHGRPRKPLKPEDAASSSAKAGKLRLLQSQLLDNHRHCRYTREALDVSSKLIEANPEVYTAWNYRKLAFGSLLAAAADPAEVKSLVDAELRLAEVALRRNPKCYAAWYHRKWMLSGRELEEVDFAREFTLLDQLLKADSRNFHGWNYRRFVAVLKGISIEEELKFMTDKINMNFSNYSAWHNRSALLSQMLKKDQDIFTREKVLSKEFELVHQALFTDPDDQSGWFYYLWLLNQTTATYNPLLGCSWPLDGSNLISSTNGNFDYGAFEKRYPLDSFLRRGRLPIVLYFDQPVKGVNSSTVEVKSSFIKNEDLMWKPVSTSTSTEGNFWMTYIKVPELETVSSNACRIEVSVGHTHGIISSSGSPFVSPYQFGFTIHLRNNHLEQANAGKDLVAWETAELCTVENIPGQINELKVSEHDDHKYSKWLFQTLDKEIELFSDLLDCKIGKLTMARLLLVHGTISKQKNHTQEILKLYDDLMKLDPSHVRYYKDEKSVILMDEVTSSMLSLAKCCWKRTGADSLRSQGDIILRLDNLSLSRTGFGERLLWVRALDLSNNELRSTEGLEALQLLSYLNLRNNKISSFSALENLKLMCSLEVLDISHNEIGLHSIDTARYWCASPLSNSAPGDLNGENYTSGEETAEHLNAVFLFRDLHLTQLHIVGNAAATDVLRSLVIKVLPTLKFLDGSVVQGLV